jgi:hypothetical protein
MPERTTMTPLPHCRAHLLSLALIVLGVACLGCASCTAIRDQTQADCQVSLQAAFNAAQSLPPSKQTAAIQANVVAVGAAIGATVSTTGAAVTGATP